MIKILGLGTGVQASGLLNGDGGGNDQFSSGLDQVMTQAEMEIGLDGGGGSSCIKLDEAQAGAVPVIAQSRGYSVT